MYSIVEATRTTIIKKKRGQDDHNVQKKPKGNQSDEEWGIKQESEEVAVRCVI